MPNLIIPARMKSSRFPGKPLVPIAGKPLILRVCDVAVSVMGSEKVFVATESTEISSLVEGSGYRSVLTSDECRTGTDRVAEAARKLGIDGVLNLQGDEPLVRPEHVELMLRVSAEEPDISHNCFARIKSSKELTSLNVPKVVLDQNQALLYASRLGIPGRKGEGTPPDYFKQVCIYYFSEPDLSLYGPGTQKSSLEDSEDIEILRILEHGRTVRMHMVDGAFQAVDVPSDVQIVESLLAGA